MVVLLSDTSDAIKKIIKFVKCIQNEEGLIIPFIRSENGGEFVRDLKLL